MKDPVRVNKRSKDSKCKMLKGVSFQYCLPCSGSRKTCPCSGPRKTWAAGNRYDEVSFRIVRNK